MVAICLKDVPHVECITASVLLKISEASISDALKSKTGRTSKLDAAINKSLE
jgi:hypothetical protein